MMMITIFSREVECESILGSCIACEDNIILDEQTPASIGCAILIRTKRYHLFATGIVIAVVVEHGVFEKYILCTAHNISINEINVVNDG